MLIGTFFIFVFFLRCTRGRVKYDGDCIDEVCHCYLAFFRVRPLQMATKQTHVSWPRWLS